MDTHKMTLFKKNPRNLKEADGSQYHEVSTGTYASLFPFFLPINLKNCHVQVKRNFAVCK